MLELLERLEWITFGYRRKCIICDSWGDEGHYGDCALAEAIEELKIIRYNSQFSVRS